MSMTLGYHTRDELSLDNPKRVLVRGDRIYKGNDTKFLVLKCVTDDKNNLRTTTIDEETGFI